MSGFGDRSVVLRECRSVFLDLFRTVPAVHQ